MLSNPSIRVNATKKFSSFELLGDASSDASSPSTPAPAVSAGAPKAAPAKAVQGGFVPKGKQTENQVYVPKTPLGMVDILPEQMATREEVFRKIRTVFKKHGAVEIETPVCELKETLVGKYGEDSKLVYDLQDQGGELLSLRYDLTVPFARYCAEHSVDKMRRFHIARVYRRDRPSIERGRFREFYQCDFDCAGEFESMVPDAECVKIVSEILDSVGLKGKYLVRINHRALLDGVFGLCGVPEDKFRAVCSAVDKLDKETWDKVRVEMIEQKGVDPAVVDKLAMFVGPDAKCAKDLMVMSEMVNAWPEKIEKHLDACNLAVTQLQKLFAFCEAMGVETSSRGFDMTMARGLDYYTGVIYEVVMTNDQGLSVGSISGGGRYDNLVGMFDKPKKGKPRKQLPCVGISIGIERLFTVVEQLRRKEQATAKTAPPSTLDAFVGYIPSSKDTSDQSLVVRMGLARELWGADLRAEFLQKGNPKLGPQFDACKSMRAPVMVYVGETEIKEGIVCIKSYKYGMGEDGKITQETVKDAKVPRADLVAAVKEALMNST